MLPWIVAGGMGALSAFSSYSGAKAQNRAASQAQANASRRYALQANIAKNQMEEQQSIAMEKMTDITRSFVLAKGKAKTIQAETMVGGNVQKRLAHQTAMKSSEAKGKIAKEIDTNVVNIAQDMLAKKIDTEAVIAEAESKKKNVFTETAIGTMNGALQGYQLGSALSSSSLFSSGKDAVSTSIKPDAIYDNNYEFNLMWN